MTRKMLKLRAKVILYNSELEALLDADSNAPRRSIVSVGEAIEYSEKLFKVNDLYGSHNV